MKIILFSIDLTLTIAHTKSNLLLAEHLLSEGVYSLPHILTYAKYLMFAKLDNPNMSWKKNYELLYTCSDLAYNQTD